MSIIVKQQRPVNLNLTTIHFPIMAIVSILHRMSGVILFLAIPLVLWALQQSLVAPDSFYDLKLTLSSPFAKLCLWVFLSALIYHLFAGIRHLLMNIGIAESLEGGRLGAFIVAVASAVMVVLVGICIW